MCTIIAVTLTFLVKLVVDNESYNVMAQDGVINYYESRSSLLMKQHLQLINGQRYYHKVYDNLIKVD